MLLCHRICVEELVSLEVRATVNSLLRYYWRAVPRFPVEKLDSSVLGVGEFMTSFDGGVDLTRVIKRHEGSRKARRTYVRSVWGESEREK